jgi:hypothetical protein
MRSYQLCNDVYNGDERAIVIQRNDLEKGRKCDAIPPCRDPPAETDAVGGFIAVCVCLLMVVLLYFALSYPTNQYYRTHYPNHPPPMYTMPQNYQYFYGS